MTIAANHPARKPLAIACLVALAALIIAFLTLTSDGHAAKVTDYFARYGILVGEQTIANKLTVNESSGTAIYAIRAASVNVASGDTSATLSLSGVASTDLIVATITSGNSSSRSVLKATPGTDSVAVLLSGTPGATTAVSVVALDITE